MDWLIKNLQSIQENYGGQWVGIKDSEIISFAPTVPELQNLIDNKDNVFITFIIESQYRRSYV
jgi:hypothetical protein